jgi:hypothetical protein
MTEGNIYDAVDRYSKQGKIAYIHLRNVVGKVPHYRETFVDEGDVDMLRILTILHRNHFEGVLIPDHTPQMTCSAPWHAGMAHTLGFMLAAKAALESSQQYSAELTTASWRPVTEPFIRRIPACPSRHCGQRFHFWRLAVWLRQHRDQRRDWILEPVVSS